MHDLTRDVREPEIVAVSPVCQTLVVGADQVEAFQSRRIIRAHRGKSRERYLGGQDR